MTKPELVPWPPCANERKQGAYCDECAYCLRRKYGPEWWLWLKDSAKSIQKKV